MQSSYVPLSNASPHRKMGGDNAPGSFQGSLNGLTAYKLGSAADHVTVSVNHVLEETAIHNIFGVIKGNEEPGNDVNIMQFCK